MGVKEVEEALEKALHDGGNGGYITMNQIVKKSGCSIKSVCRDISKMVKRGEIKMYTVPYPMKYYKLDLGFFGETEEEVLGKKLKDKPEVEVIDND